MPLSDSNGRVLRSEETDFIVKLPVLHRRNVNLRLFLLSRAVPSRLHTLTDFSLFVHSFYTSEVFFFCYSRSFDEISKNRGR